MEAATADSWKREEFPDRYALLDFHERFTPEEYEVISRGLVPEQMEDKWFVYMENDVLRLHRSWTGHCIFEVEFAEDGGAHVARTAKVNRDETEYSETDDDYDARLLRFVIRGLILGEEAELPMPPGLADGIMSDMYRHHLVGRAAGGPEDGGGPEGEEGSAVDGEAGPDTGPGEGQG